MAKSKKQTQKSEETIEASTEQVKNPLAENVIIESKDEVQKVHPNEAKARWYAVHTYSGYEEQVAESLKQRIESMGVADKIFDVIVPKEKNIEIKDGKRKILDKKIFPGYVMVKMIVAEDSWFVVRNTPRVTGFVGSGVYPVPLSQKEIDHLFGRMNTDTSKHAIDLDTDDVVVIVDGPFKELEGKVEGVDTERGKVKVMVSMFGRETPVELDFLQVKKI